MNMHGIKRDDNGHNHFKRIQNYDQLDGTLPTLTKDLVFRNSSHIIMKYCIFLKPTNPRVSVISRPINMHSEIYQLLGF